MSTKVMLIVAALIGATAVFALVPKSQKPAVDHSQDAAIAAENKGLAARSQGFLDAVKNQ
jgi:hypothetical protein